MEFEREDFIANNENDNDGFDDIRNETEEARIYAAESSETPEEILEVLSDDERTRVREGVASNENCPVEILIKLGSDKNTNILLAVIENKNTPIEIVEKLSESEIKEVSDAAKKKLIPAS